MSHRTESDSLGNVDVPADKYWGAQTERSRQNFVIGNETMPIEVIRAMAIVKKASAIVNADLDLLPKEISNAIQSVCIGFYGWN